MKKFLYIIIIFIILLFYFAKPDAAINASKQGLFLWFEQILPTLLPFTVISSILIASGFVKYLQEKSKRQKEIPVTEIFIIIFGFLLGFPIGSKLTADSYEQHMIGKKQAQILCAFTNNLSPAFIMGYVLNQSFQKCYPIGLTIAVLYICPCTLGVVQLLHNLPIIQPQKKTASRFELNMQIVDAGIISGFETLIKLCGYIVLFSMLCSMIQYIPWKNLPLKLFLIGNLEVTNGIHLLSNCHINPFAKYLFMIEILSFGGISGIAQTGSMISKVDLSLKKYVEYKMIYCAFNVIMASFVYLLFIC